MVDLTVLRFGGAVVLPTAVEWLGFLIQSSTTELVRRVHRGVDNGDGQPVQFLVQEKVSGPML